MSTPDGSLIFPPADLISFPDSNSRHSESCLTSYTGLPLLDQDLDLQSSSMSYTSVGDVLTQPTSTSTPSIERSHIAHIPQARCPNRWHASCGHSEFHCVLEPCRYHVALCHERSSVPVQTYDASLGDWDRSEVYLNSSIYERTTTTPHNHLTARREDNKESFDDRITESTVLICKWQGCSSSNVFNRAGDLIRHIRYAHVMPLSFKCGIDGCRRSFNRKDNMKQHILTMHRKNANGLE
ncbi:hypothetical protein BDV23DRAFT_62331 [Aspergillus alliaceus]|uniref:C2H2-type domain-containing protein n=1 Tax=Petromyces alliaceus TaxID=209559 RepID=A0A5N7CCN9_PETAA|nr:hypothetical protein BDV23DRAFT_62331 [Aspergillus alliaceus]